MEETMTRLTEQEKQMITIHRRINELLEEDHRYNNLTESKIQTVVKACHKFLKNCEGTKYSTDKSRFGYPMTHTLKVNLEHRDRIPYNNELETGTYLTWISFGTHEMIHRYCQEYDPNDIDSKSTKNFYKKTLEQLTRI